MEFTKTYFCASVAHRYHLQTEVIGSPGVLTDDCKLKTLCGYMFFVVQVTFSLLINFTTLLSNVCFISLSPWQTHSLSTSHFSYSFLYLT